MKRMFLTALTMAVGVGASAHADDVACEALRDYEAPPVGTVFTYEVRHRGEAIPVWILHTVSDVDGSLVEYTHQFESSDGSRPPSTPRTQSADAGMFPVTEGVTESGDPIRTRRYDQPVTEILAGLEPGSTAEFESSETSSMNNRTRTVTAPAQLIFNRCDMIEVDGTDEPVRVYDLVYTARTYVAGRRPRADMTAEKQNTIYLSDRYGYPLRIDSETGHVQVIRVELPGADGTDDQ
ncbi:hypothetical protein [Hyphobacterium marinum]|uniref:DUF3108 domain-containing protein n=1 Tax=Hyphobacterium marinum TaxID=3116574 RepID=A0ABU7LXN3_9PROT|nr:hypothetical protein [Hyphobacterium sp. Y6023]MEE2566308.1 hypothetical protein [Hyphobacterium sp. Y6023]